MVLGNYRDRVNHRSWSSCHSVSGEVDGKERGSSSVLKPIYVEGDLSDWHTHLTLERVVLRHHCCSKDCQVTRTCDAHPSGCHLQCETATIKISHAKTGEFLIDEHYRTLSS